MVNNLISNPRSIYDLFSITPLSTVPNTVNRKLFLLQCSSIVVFSKIPYSKQEWVATMLVYVHSGFFRETNKIFIKYGKILILPQFAVIT